jgi:hypothetical protein
MKKRGGVFWLVTVRSVSLSPGHLPAYTALGLQNVEMRVSQVDVIIVLRVYYNRSYPSGAGLSGVSELPWI